MVDQFTYYHNPAMMTDFYWRNYRPVKETLAAWEKRHVLCRVVQGNGVVFWDWHAAKKKKGKRHGPPEGWPNGVVGRMVKDEPWHKYLTPKLVALYNRYYKEVGVVCQKAYCDYPYGYFDFIDGKPAKAEGKFYSERHIAWWEANLAELEPALAEIQAMRDADNDALVDELGLDLDKKGESPAASEVVSTPEPTPTPDPIPAPQPTPNHQAFYSEYVAVLAKAKLAPRPFEEWVAGWTQGA